MDSSGPFRPPSRTAASTRSPSAFRSRTRRTCWRGKSRRSSAGSPAGGLRSVRLAAEEELHAQADHRRAFARLVALEAGPGVAGDQLAEEVGLAHRLAVDGACAVFLELDLGLGGGAQEELPGHRPRVVEVVINDDRRASCQSFGGLGEGADVAPAEEQVAAQHAVEVDTGGRAVSLTVFPEDRLPEPPDVAVAGEDVVPVAGLDEDLGRALQPGSDAEVELVLPSSRRRIAETAEPLLLGLQTEDRGADGEPLPAVLDELVAVVASEEEVDPAFQVGQVIPQPQAWFDLEPVEFRVERRQLDAARNRARVRDVGLAAEEAVEPQGGTAEGLLEHPPRLVDHLAFRRLAAEVAQPDGLGRRAGRRGFSRCRGRSALRLARG